MKCPTRPLPAALALFVLAACGGAGNDTIDTDTPAVEPPEAAAVAPETGTPEALPPEDAAVLTVDATLEDAALTLSRDSVPAGTVAIRVRNGGTMAHGLQISGNGLEFETPPVAAGDEVTMTLNLEQGVYRLLRTGTGITPGRAALTAQLNVR